MNFTDLYFSVGSRASLDALLAEHGITPASGGWALDWIGLLVDQPATFSGTTPIAPATFLEGQRAALRLWGPLAQTRAAALYPYAIPAADVPASQMRWGGGSQPWAPAGESVPQQPAPVVVPVSVKRRQLFLVLLEGFGITRAQIRAKVAEFGEAALTEYDEASEFERANPLIDLLAAEFGLSTAQVDAIFIEAATR